MARSQLAWHPDGGSLLAAPGTDHDVVLYERMSWEVAFALAGQHTADVSALAFSRNGAGGRGGVGGGEKRRAAPARNRCAAERCSEQAGGSCMLPVPALPPWPSPPTARPPTASQCCHRRRRRRRRRLPAGLYLVSTGADQAVVLWDVSERKALEKRLLPGCATGLAWHPTRNELAVITEDGELASVGGGRGVAVCCVCCG